MFSVEGLYKHAVEELSKRMNLVSRSFPTQCPSLYAVFLVMMLIHGPPVVGSAVVPAAPGAVHHDIVLIPTRLGPKLAVTMRAHEAVFCVIMIRHRHLVPKFAVALGTSNAMLCDVVLIHPPLSLEPETALRAFYQAVLSIVVLIPGCLRPELAIAFGAFDAVSRIVVLLHRILRREFTIALGTTRVRTPLKLRAVVSWTTIVCIIRISRTAVSIRVMRRPGTSSAVGTHEDMFCQDMRFQCVM